MGDFKNMLKYLRNREDLSQSELALKLGVSKSTISMYEVGQREPDFETLASIADFFNVDMNFLLGSTEKESIEAKRRIDTLAAHFEGAEYTDEELEEIIQFAKFVRSQRK